MSDDDRDLNYKLIQLGAGYQLTDNLYSSLTFEHYDVDLKDGNTAFQAYQLHSMASGRAHKNKAMLYARYTLGGAEFGINYEYNFGTFEPDFGRRLRAAGGRCRIAHDFGVPSARWASPAASAAGTAWRSGTSRSSG